MSRAPSLTTVLMLCLWATAFVLGCAPESGGGGGTAVGCTPNLTQMCVCPDGAAGVQACQEDGAGWTPCGCAGGSDDARVSPPAPDGATLESDGGSPLADATVPGPDSDADVPDAAQVDSDGAVPPDAAAPQPDAAPVALPEDAVLGTIADLIEVGDGPVNMLVTGLYVTYTRGSGYYVQAQRQGPAAWVFIEPNVHGIAVGEKLSLWVREVGAYNGALQIEQAAVWTNDHGAHDVVGLLAQDLAAGGGVVPGEGHENELVRVAGVRKLSGNRGRFMASYGAQAVSVHFEVFDALSLEICQGATFDLRTGVIFEDEVVGAESTYYVRSHSHTDLANINERTCPTVDDSNWGFEAWALNEPIEDFNEDAGDKLIVEPDANRVHGGATSARLWSAYSGDDEAELSTAHRVPVAAGGTATCSLWVYDDDPDGRVRLFLSWWDADGTRVGPNNFAQDQSEDASAWAQLVLEGEAPVGAAGVTCGLRMYPLDDLADDGQIVIHVDDLDLSTR
jgi:hypothetical protein